MKNLNSLADIVFFDTNKDKITAEIINAYEAASGRSLASGDPIRLFLLAIANIIILLLNQINETGKQNLLRYASGVNLDHKGLEMGVERNQATAAKTTIKIFLSAKMSKPVAIQAGTRFSAGDNIFFALDNTVVIPAGITEGDGTATCLDASEAGNGYLPGQIKNLVDPVPYVDHITNSTESAGGADAQSDDSYRTDIQLAPEKFSTAGPTGAYEYYAKHASTDIIDACVWSPSAGVVEIRPLLTGGEIPNQELLNIVKNACNDRSVRPLTDYVQVKAPEAVQYDINLTCYIDKTNVAQASAIQFAVTAAVDDYVTWQKSKLGRDINPSELIARVMQTGVKRVAVTAPSFMVLQKTQVAQEADVTVTLGGIEDA